MQSRNNSPPKVYLAKVVLYICSSKFTGERQCRSVILIKLQSNFIEITLQHGCSPVNLLHIFITPVLRPPLEGCFWISKTRKELEHSDKKVRSWVTYFSLFKVAYNIFIKLIKATRELAKISKIVQLLLPGSVAWLPASTRTTTCPIQWVLGDLQWLSIAPWSSRINKKNK